MIKIAPITAAPNATAFVLRVANSVFAFCALTAGVIAILCATTMMPALAQNSTKGTTPKPLFEFEAGGGAEWGRFASVGPYSNTTQDLGRLTAAKAELSGWSGVFEAHALFRPRIAQPFGIGAYRLDIRYSHGTASTFDAFRKPGTNGEFFIPSVNGGFVDGLGIADGASISSNIQQDRTSWRVKPSLVWERSAGQIETAFRVGAGYASLRQNETISILGFDLVVPTFAQINVTTTGSVITRAVGLIAGFDVRAPIQPSLALVGALEANLDFARTNYDGRTTDNLGLAAQQAITVGKSHVMPELRASGGFEWMPVTGWTFKLLGEAGWQSGIPRIVYPQFEVVSPTNLNTTTDGPAHIDLENRWFYGARAAVLLRF